LGTGAVFGTGTLDTFPYASVPFETGTERVVHPVYFLTDGEFIQLQITMNDTQMTTVIPIDDGMGNIDYVGPTFEDFELHFMCFYARPTSNRFQ